MFDVTTGQLLLKLTPEDAGSGKEFGYSVSLSGNLALVSNRFDNCAYLFDATTGQQLHKLSPTDGNVDGGFGNSVSLSGNLALIGSSEDNENGFGSGSAYLFDTTTGQQVHKLLPIDSDAGQNFGWSVSLSGNFALIGAMGDNIFGPSSGSAYLFNATTGQQLHKLTPADGGIYHSFGLSVSLSGNLALIGAPGDDANGSNSGSAYLFEATTGQQLRKLTPLDVGVNGNFGISTSLVGSTALVGAWLREEIFLSPFDVGSAYFFDTATGKQLHKITTPNGPGFDAFATSVSLSGNLALVGARMEEGRIGSAYVYDISSVIAGEPLKVRIVPNEFNAYLIEFPTSTGKNYVLENSENLKIWTDTGQSLPGTGSEQSFTVQVTGPKKFYRILECPEP